MRGKTEVGIGSVEPLSDRLDRIDAVMVEDPGEALPMAEAVVEEHPESARAWTTLGAAYRRTGVFSLSREAFERAERLPSTPFDKAQAYCWHALLFAEESNFAAALGKIEHAEGLHGQSGLDGPAQRGLPSIIVTRGEILWAAAAANDSLGNLQEAGRCYRCALRMLGEKPMESAPNVFLVATQGAGIVALHAGQLTKANAALKAATASVDEIWLTETVPGAKLQWVEAVVGAELFGFAEQWRRELDRAEKILYRNGALLDSVIAGCDYMLYLLEEKETPWKELEERLTHYLAILDSEGVPQEMSAALSLFLVNVHRRRIRYDCLSYIYKTIAFTLRKPETRHARCEEADDVGEHLWSMMDHGMNVIEGRFPDLTWKRLSHHMTEYLLDKKVRMERSSKKRTRTLKKA